LTAESLASLLLSNWTRKFEIVPNPKKSARRRDEKAGKFFEAAQTLLPPVDR
jgi:hypothetical protein